MIKKKSLGQHFLKSKSALLAIVEASNPKENDIVLEIGPGEGVLTEILLKNVRKVIAVEKDHRLIPILQEKFIKEITSKKLTLIHSDILNLTTLKTATQSYLHTLSVCKYKVVANIPYYITGQILRMFLESDNQPESMTLLVQKEVAERIVAKDGKESLLSLSVKAYGEPKIVRTVGRGAFNPPPNVDSAILLIENISKKKLGRYEKDFFKLIHAGFAHKRKQLLSNLNNMNKDMLIMAFRKCGIDPKARAEDLPLETWLKLCNNL